MPSGFKWSKRSLKQLEEFGGIHKDLRKVTDLALQLSPIDFIITDGRRTIAEQRKHVANGASKTMKSRHLTGHAVDFVAYVKVDGNTMKVSYKETYMRQVADAFSAAAKQLGIPITRGIDWGWDSPHIELDKKKYPALRRLKMDGPMISSLARHFLTFLGGALVTLGWFDQATAQQLVGALSTLAGVLWSFFDKKHVQALLSDK